jgi:ubiquinone/menaquinone biosynthesis C-methylase UbiE
MVPAGAAQASRHADAAIVATDLAASMLEVARAIVQQAHLQDRIELVLTDAKRLDLADNQFPLVISNSIVHHIPEPVPVLQEAVRVAGQGVFFRDLMRPDSERHLHHLVLEYASGESDHARSMFADSLRAALSLDEMRELVSSLGLSAESVTATSDRHWTWFALVGENRVHP